MKPYRPNAAVIITDGKGHVLLCERNDPEWPFVQTVQGGIDPGETPREAAVREVYEEIGLRPDQFTIVAELPEKLRYDFPPALVAGTDLDRYRGQEQAYFLAQTAHDVQFVLDTHESKEFARVYWGTPAEMVAKAWDIKRDRLEKALRGFGLLTDE